jgi:nucleotide-binding universal stress UspA family protein
MRRVLVPLDGTKDAEAALASLEQLCNADDEIILLSIAKPEARLRSGSRPGMVMASAIGGPGGGVEESITPESPVYQETIAQTQQRQTDETKDYLENLAGAMRRQGFTVNTVVDIDENPGDAIVRYAKQTHPTFIAMLRRTRVGIGELVFGSVASTVTRSDVAPVLFVPPANN